MKTANLAHLTPALLAAALSAACGSTVIEGSGAAAGSSGSSGTAGTAGATGGTTVIPPECSVETTETGPFAVTFEFTNPGGQPFFLRRDCALNYAITSCDKEFSEALGLSGACTVDCSQVNECIQCGPCPEEAVMVPTGTPVQDSWSGKIYTFGQNNAGCTCHDEHIAPAQIYRLTVPVFASAEDAMTNQPPFFEASADFILPSPSDFVTVTLSPKK